MKEAFLSNQLFGGGKKMEEHLKMDFSELARLILEGVEAFPQSFLESFCLPHDCFRDRNYTPDEQTIENVKATFRSFVERYQLSCEEMKLIVEHKSSMCCSNPVSQLVTRWMTKHKLLFRGSRSVWRKNEIIILDLDDLALDMEVADCIFKESRGRQKVRIVRQFNNNFFPIKTPCDLNNLNATIPTVLIGSQRYDGQKEVRLDLNSVLHQKQKFRFYREDKILGEVDLYYNGQNVIGYYLWEPDLAGIYRAKAYFLLVDSKESGKEVEIVSNLVERMVIPWD